MLLDALLTSCDILSRDRSLKEFECSKGLVERNLVARLVDPNKGVQVTLTNLAVNNSIGGSQVNEACLFVTRCIDLVGDDLSSKPVAVKVTTTVS